MFPAKVSVTSSRGLPHLLLPDPICRSAPQCAYMTFYLLPSFSHLLACFNSRQSGPCSF